MKINTTEQVASVYYILVWHSVMYNIVYKYNIIREFTLFIILYFIVLFIVV